MREVVGKNIKLFLDVKFHDIPNTVAKASVEVARLGVWMFNIHALGGGEMMRRTVENVREVCEKENLETTENYRRDGFDELEPGNLARSRDR